MLQQKTYEVDREHISYLDYTSENLIFAPKEENLAWKDAPHRSFMVPMQIKMKDGIYPFRMKGCEFITYVGIVQHMCRENSDMTPTWFIHCIIENDMFFNTIMQIHQQCDVYLNKQELQNSHKENDRYWCEKIELFYSFVVKVSEGAIFTDLNGDAVSHAQLNKTYFRFIPVLEVKLFYTANGNAALRMDILKAPITSFDYHARPTKNKFTHHLFTLCRIKRDQPDIVRKIQNQLIYHNLYTATTSPWYKVDLVGDRWYTAHIYWFF